MSNIKSLEEMKPKNDTRVFIGIDPGKSGGCGVIYIEDGVENSFNFKFPKQIDLLSVGLMAMIPPGLSLEDVHVLVEHVHAFPKQGAVSTFSFGQNLGHWEGTLYANEFNFTYVNPKEWIYWYGIPKGLEKKNQVELQYLCVHIGDNVRKLYLRYPQALSSRRLFVLVSLLGRNLQTLR